jgi:hypothetical protein
MDKATTYLITYLPTFETSSFFTRTKLPSLYWGKEGRSIKSGIIHRDINLKVPTSEGSVLFAIPAKI